MWFFRVEFLLWLLERPARLLTDPVWLTGQSFKFGSFGDGNGELNYPCYVAVNPQGHIIVSDMHSHRIQVWIQTLHFHSSVSQTLNKKCCLYPERQKFSRFHVVFFIKVFWILRHSRSRYYRARRKCLSHYYGATSQQDLSAFLWHCCTAVLHQYLFKN